MTGTELEGVISSMKEDYVAGLDKFNTEYEGEEIHLRASRLYGQLEYLHTKITELTEQYRIKCNIPNLPNPK